MDETSRLAQDERIAALTLTVRRRRETRQQERDTFRARRDAGLEARHRRKLARLA